MPQCVILYHLLKHRVSEEDNKMKTMQKYVLATCNSKLLMETSLSIISARIDA